MHTAHYVRNALKYDIPYSTSITERHNMAANCPTHNQNLSQSHDRMAILLHDKPTKQSAYQHKTNRPTWGAFE